MDPGAFSGEFDEPTIVGRVRDREGEVRGRPLKQPLAVHDLPSTEGRLSHKTV
jgi:hypothetical protein